MCGIITISRRDKLPANKMTAKRYEDQKTRGQSGFGFIAIDENGDMQAWERSEDEETILKALKERKEPTIVFHHRQPTSTPNFIEATHPIYVSNELLDHDYYMIHNGIISNDEKLKETHEKLGFLYTTEIEKVYKTKEGTEYRDKDFNVFNDSEALAVELALVIDGQQKEIMAEGSIAFVVIQAEKGGRKVKAIYYGRNYGNPLKEDLAKDFMALTSEGNGGLVEADKLNRLDLMTGFISEEKLEIGDYAYSSTYGKKSYGFDTTSTEVSTDSTDTIDTTSYEDEELYNLMEQEEMMQKRIDRFDQYNPASDEEVFWDLMDQLAEIQQAIKKHQDKLDKRDLEDADAMAESFYNKHRPEQRPELPIILG